MNGVERLTWTQKQILATYARCDMNVRKTAEAAFLTAKDIDYHLRMVNIKTGLDPRRFIDLVRLLRLTGNGDMLGGGE